MKISRLVLGLLLAVSVFSSCKDEDEIDTCSDGIRNYTETGVDCGGTCDPCLATCDDGIQNGNETGISSGGNENCTPSMVEPQNLLKEAFQIVLNN